jgi:hypothetical protein
MFGGTEMASELTQIPEWLGTAVIGAIIAALGYVGKQVLDGLAAVREKKRERRARLVELQSLLRATRVSFTIQNTHAQRLTAMILENHPNVTQPEGGYDRIFATTYPQFTSEEKELHDIIRSITINSLRPVNQSLLEWLKQDIYFKAHYHKNTRMGELAKQLANLEAHLLLWHAKYEAWIPNTPRHALLYLADEDAHGLRFPTEIDQVVQKMLEEE